MEGITPPSVAGWYPDPYGHFGLRWWDGQKWANDTKQFVSLTPSGKAADLSTGTARFIISQPVMSAILVAFFLGFFVAPFSWVVAIAICLPVIIALLIWRQNHLYDFPDLAPKGKASAKADSLERRRRVIAATRPVDVRPRCRKCGSTSLKTHRVDPKNKNRFGQQQVKIICGRCGHKRQRVL